uniref:Uncharacterized protein n=1 Tax=Romanomermis culicivorax TaxID=13658 RepID=A0A915KS89_ROMCU
MPPSKKQPDSREDKRSRERIRNRFGITRTTYTVYCTKTNHSKDHQKRIQLASALKRDQLRKEELEGQQPPMADSEQMMEEPTTSQQAEVASEQQKPQGIVREYKIP